MHPGTHASCDRCSSSLEDLNTQVSPSGWQLPGAGLENKQRGSGGWHLIHAFLWLCQVQQITSQQRSIYRDVSMFPFSLWILFFWFCFFFCCGLALFHALHFCRYLDFWNPRRGAANTRRWDKVFWSANRSCRRLGDALARCASKQLKKQTPTSGSLWLFDPSQLLLLLQKQEKRAWEPLPFIKPNTVPLGSTDSFTLH